MKGVLALPGAFIPGTGHHLKKGEIRGVASEAMLLSAREMGLGRRPFGHRGPAGGRAARRRLRRLGGARRPGVEIGVTPNRGDALSVHGVARDWPRPGLGR
jgi:phenylalanyl-tRNA synthetase beta chain